MGKIRKTVDSWFNRVADRMVRQNWSIRQAADDLNLGIAPEELYLIEKKKAFQEALWAARNRFYTELASQPGHTKAALEGLMILTIQKLIESGDYDKALVGAEKLAKLTGWQGGDNTVNVFGSVTAKDIEEARKRLEQKEPPAGGQVEFSLPTKPSQDPLVN